MAGVNRIQYQLTTRHVPIRHRDLLLEVTGVDSDLLLNDVLIQFCSAYVDQGLARVRRKNVKAPDFPIFLSELFNED